MIKKITLVSGIFPPDIGGPATFIPMLANFLTESNVEVNVITLSDKKKSEITKYKIETISRSIIWPIRFFITVYKIYLSAKTSDLIFSNTLDFEASVASIISRKKHIQKIVGDIAWERANSSGRYNGSIDDYQTDQHCLISRLTNIYRNFSLRRSHLIITPSKYLKED